MISTDTRTFRLVLFSFGFKHGAPADAQMMFDVRFLPNPYWQEDLRPMSGHDQAVSSYVIDSKAGREFQDLVKPLLVFLIRESIANEQSDLRLAVGCTGGRHRSVAVVEALADDLRKGLQRELHPDADLQITIFHRDIDKT